MLLTGKAGTAERMVWLTAELYKSCKVAFEL